jgi:hypothetical protein
MSLLRVARFLHHPDCEIGRVFIDEEFFCYSIEDAYRTTKIAGQTCIPNGEYSLGLRWSPKFSPRYNHQLIWVQDVPNFQFILIHTGNTVDDTEGCLIIGDKIGVVKQKDAVLNSRATYLRFYNRVIGPITAGGQTIRYDQI